MNERLPANFNREFTPRVLSEIRRPYKKEVKLFDRKEALLADDKIILAYKHLWFSEKDLVGENGKKIRVNRILVARERTIPIKIQRTGREVIYPYSNEEELKGIYGVLAIGVSEYRPIFYIGEQYKVTFEGSFYEVGQRSANITVESTDPIKTQPVDGQMDFNHYLMLLNKKRDKQPLY